MSQHSMMQAKFVKDYRKHLSETGTREAAVQAMADKVMVAGKVPEERREALTANIRAHVAKFERDTIFQMDFDLTEK